MPNFHERFTGLPFQIELLIMNIIGLVNSTSDWSPLKWTAQVEKIWELPLAQHSFAFDLIDEEKVKTILKWIVVARIIFAHVYTFAYVTNIYSVVTWSRPNLLLPWMVLSFVKNIVLEVAVIGLAILLRLPFLLLLEFVLLKVISLALTVYTWHANSHLFLHLKRLEKLSKQGNLKSLSELPNGRALERIAESFPCGRFKSRSLSTLLSFGSQDTNDSRDSVSRILEDSSLTPAEKSTKILGLTEEEIARARNRVQGRASEYSFKEVLRESEESSLEDSGRESPEAPGDEDVSDAVVDYELSERKDEGSHTEPFLRDAGVQEDRAPGRSEEKEKPPVGGDKEEAPVASLRSRPCAALVEEREKKFCPAMKEQGLASAEGLCKTMDSMAPMGNLYNGEKETENERPVSSRQEASVLVDKRSEPKSGDTGTNRFEVYTCNYFSIETDEKEDELMRRFGGRLKRLRAMTSEIATDKDLSFDDEPYFNETPRSPKSIDKEENGPRDVATSIDCFVSASTDTTETEACSALEAEPETSINNRREERTEKKACPGDLDSEPGKKPDSVEPSLDANCICDSEVVKGTEGRREGPRVVENSRCNGAKEAATHSVDPEAKDFGTVSLTEATAGRRIRGKPPIHPKRRPETRTVSVQKENVLEFSKNKCVGQTEEDIREAGGGGKRRTLKEWSEDIEIRALKAFNERTLRRDKRILEAGTRKDSSAKRADPDPDPGKVPRYRGRRASAAENKVGRDSEKRSKYSETIPAGKDRASLSEDANAASRASRGKFDRIKRMRFAEEEAELANAARKRLKAEARTIREPAKNGERGLGLEGIPAKEDAGKREVEKSDDPLKPEESLSRELNETRDNDAIDAAPAERADDTTVTIVEAKDEENASSRSPNAAVKTGNSESPAEETLPEFGTNERPAVRDSSELDGGATVRGSSEPEPPPPGSLTSPDVREIARHIDRSFRPHGVVLTNKNLPGSAGEDPEEIRQRDIVDEATAGALHSALTNKPKNMIRVFRRETRLLERSSFDLQGSPFGQVLGEHRRGRFNDEFLCQTEQDAEPVQDFLVGGDADPGQHSFLTGSTESRDSNRTESSCDVYVLTAEVQDELAGLERMLMNEITTAGEESGARIDEMVFDITEGVERLRLSDLDSRYANMKLGIIAAIAEYNDSNPETAETRETSEKPQPGKTSTEAEGNGLQRESEVVELGEPKAEEEELSGRSPEIFLNPRSSDPRGPVETCWSSSSKGDLCEELRKYTGHRKEDVEEPGDSAGKPKYQRLNVNAEEDPTISDLEQRYEEFDIDLDSCSTDRLADPADLSPETARNRISLGVILQFWLIVFLFYVCSIYDRFQQALRTYKPTRPCEMHSASTSMTRFAENSFCPLASSQNSENTGNASVKNVEQESESSEDLPDPSVHGEPAETSNNTDFPVNSEGNIKNKDSPSESQNGEAIAVANRREITEEDVPTLNNVKKEEYREGETSSSDGNALDEQQKKREAAKLEECPEQDVPLNVLVKRLADSAPRPSSNLQERDSFDSTFTRTTETSEKQISLGESSMDEFPSDDSSRADVP